MASFDRNRLKECLDSFCEFTGVPVTVYTPDGKIGGEMFPEKKICRFFPLYQSPGECMENRLFSMQLSHDMGEPYIYYCPGGLVHIAVPVIQGSKYHACAVAGPLVMGELDDRLLSQMISLNETKLAQITEIALFTSKMRRFQPKQIQYLSNLLYSVIMYGLQSWQDYEKLSRNHRWQIDIGEEIWTRKQVAQIVGDTGTPTYADLQEQLLRCILEKREEDAAAYLAKLMDELVLMEGGSFDRIKVRIFEMYLFLAKSAIEYGVPQQKIFGGESSLLNTLNNLDAFVQLEEWAKKVVLFFIYDIFADISPVSDITAQVTAYISAHYMEKLTLRDLAVQLFISDSYLSKRFRQEMDISFNDYLSKVRIERSIELMKQANLSLLEISGLVGFEDQSYFTKVFKRTTGKTPRQYRNTLAKKAKES